MLSRVANNLYWMGRYFERAEHLARYTKEIYFSSLDAPIREVYQKKFVTESMQYMAGLSNESELSENEVLFKIALDVYNPGSLLSNVTSARENARGARSAISTELWEAINKYYHFVNNYPETTFLNSGLYDLTHTVIEQSTVVKGKINDTILHDETWAIILLGINVEKVIQIIRVINSKLHDMYKIELTGHPVTKLSSEWTTLLKCTESFDMNRKYYGTIPNREEVLDFLILNEQCPRSINYCLQSIQKYLKKISKNDPFDPSSSDFIIGKLCAHYKYLTIEEFSDDVYGLLNYTQDKITSFSSDFEKNYLSF